MPRLASPARRLGAWAIDAAVVALAATPINPAVWNVGPGTGTFLVLWAIGTLAAFGYLIYFDGSASGATLGKRALGIRVGDSTTGAAIGHRRATVRRLGYAIGGLVLYLGWLWLLWDARRQTWHDKLARTAVVHVAGQ